jgi:hypothetical protein
VAWASGGRRRAAGSGGSDLGAEVSDETSGLRWGADGGARMGHSAWMGSPMAVSGWGRESRTQQLGLRPRRLTKERGREPRAREQRRARIEAAIPSASSDSARRLLPNCLPCRAREQGWSQRKGRCGRRWWTFHRRCEDGGFGDLASIDGATGGGCANLPRTAGKEIWLSFH